MSRTSEGGAALVIALLLLMILTLLATTGMRTSVAELWMAGSEQFHRKAAEAASSGLEAGVARLSASVGSLPSAMTVEGEVDGAPFSATIRHAGTEVSIPGSSAERFSGEHFEIESTGTSSRDAREVQVQGVIGIFSTNGVRTFRGSGKGLGAEGSP